MKHPKKTFIEKNPTLLRGCGKTVSQTHAVLSSPNQPRTPEVKTVTLKFRTTLTNKALKDFAEIAAGELVFNAAGLEHYKDGGSTALVAKPRVEAVGKR